MRDIVGGDIKRECGQYFTPTWAAELLLQRHFPQLTAADMVLDPSCGDGRFLLAAPENVRAFGVEIDPVTAQQARDNTGREIVTGDFCEVQLPERPTIIIGNPPFKAALIDAFLDRCYDELEYGGRVGFILPVYYFQTASTIVRLGRQWSIAQELIPRNLYEGLTKPLLFATFAKERRTLVTGFFLYAETAATLEGLRDEFRAMFIGNGARANVWRETVAAALKICGGRATLTQLYNVIENGRPTENQHWRDKVRQIAGKFFTRIREGEFALPEAA